MKFLRRKVQAKETVRERGRVVHREIEITVEREWLAAPADAQHGASTLHATREQTVDPALREVPPLPRLE